MNEPFHFLAFLADPFGVRAPIFCLRSSGEATEITANELVEAERTVITVELGALIDCLRRLGANRLPSLVDISDGLRLASGRPKDEVGEKPWNVWRQLADSSGDKERLSNIQGFFQSRTSWPEREVMVAELCWLTSQLQKLWTDLKSNLERRQEIERFLNVDMPVRSLLSTRQLAGVCVDQKKLSSAIKYVEAEKYAAFLALAPEIGRSPQSINYWNIGECLQNTPLAHLGIIEDAGAMRDALKLASLHNELARALVSYIDSVRDEATLKRCICSDGLIFPLFHAHGTITGRILVSEPSIQQLRKRYRSVLAAGDGRALVYLDYAQFEPGVVAFLSGDESLIDAYNKGDLYAALSKHMYGSVDNRKLCKQIFLAFCYGMSEATVARLMLPASATDGEVSSSCEAIRTFFAEFPGLERLRSESENLLTNQGWVSSFSGNRRYRSGSGALTFKERRWALNQRVQATASLIFKEALIGICQVFGSKSFMLPMHDAVLLEFPVDDFESAEKAIKIMEKAFSSRLPGIVPRVVRGQFADD